MADSLGTMPAPPAPASPGTEPPGWTISAPPPVGVTASGGGLAVVLGLALGVVAAAVGAFLWTTAVLVTGYQIGFAAIAVGAAVGAAVRFGSRGAGGTGLRAGAVVITLVAMAAAELLYVRELYVDWLRAEGVTDVAVPLLMPLPDMAAIVTESISADPLTLLFWLLAAATAWRLSVPAGESESTGLLGR